MCSEMIDEVVLAKGSKRRCMTILASTSIALFANGKSGPHCLASDIAIVYSPWLRISKCGIVYNSNMRLH